MKRYSPSTRGFYADEIHGAAIPKDAVEITDEDHRALMEGQAAGRIIVPGPGGKPILLDPPRPSDEQLWENVRDRRDKLLRDTDFGADTPPSVVERFRGYRQALRDLPSTATDPTKIVWPKPPV